jgi:hypothetical protein
MRIVTGRVAVPEALVAVREIRYRPLLPGAGVPVMVAVPLPLSENDRPAGLTYAIVTDDRTGKSSTRRGRGEVLSW